MKNVTDESAGWRKTGESHLKGVDVFRAAIEASDDGFWLADRDGRLLEVNDAYVTGSGFTREELLAMRVTDLETRETPAETGAHIEKVISEGHDTFETLHRRKDGTVWLLEVSASYRQLYGGLFFCFLRDLSRRKRSELLLRISLELSDLAARGTVDDLLQYALDAAELHTGSSIGFFHFVNADQEQLTLQTWSTNTLKNMCTAKGKGNHYPVSRAGVWADCLDRKAPVIHNDYPSLPHRKGMPEGHAPVRRELTLPVICDGKVVAITGVGNKTTDYTQEDVDLVHEIASSAVNKVLRKRAETEREQFFKFFQTSADLMAITDPTGAFLQTNPAFSEVLGYSEAELVSKPFVEFIHPEDRQLTIDEMAGQMQRGFTLNFENRYICKDGSVRWLSWRAIFNKAEGITYATARDITEGKETDLMLRGALAEAQRFREALDHVGAYVYIKDTQHRYLYANRPTLELFGCSAGELVGCDDTLFFPAATAKQLREVDARVLQGEQTAGEIDVPDAEGGRRIYWEVKTPIYEPPERKARGLLGISTDITELKRVEENARQKEQFIRNILDSVDEGFIVIDRDYRILKANRSYCSQTGCCEENIIGRHCYETAHQTDRCCFDAGEECAARQAFASGKPHTSLHRHKDAHGTILTVETKAYPLKDASGAVTSVIETVNDISEKILLEEERIKTQKLESIGTLAGGIAHDFNNLLQGVFGYISLAKLVLDQREKALEMLNQAEEALHLSVNLTSQLLTFSKGGKPLKKLIGIRPAVENALKFALSGSHTNYEMEVPDGLWSVEADEGQLAQVIQNIALNANEAMTGSGTVRVSLANVEIAKDTTVSLPNGGKFVRIAIQDSGPGIPEQNLARIFDPYFTTKVKGSGLGLATSYSIIKNHGGIIDVESELNRSATFFIYLPALKDAEPVAAPGTSEAAGATKGRILLMDDEEMVRSVAQAMLAALGHDVATAKDGSMAVELFQQARAAGTPFDLVILDLTVKGGMGGEEAILKIRAIDPEVKAVVSSGYADSPVVANYRAYGFSAVMNKPFSIGALKNCLKQFFP